MDHYFNQAAYTRWLRSYNMTLTHYVDHIYLMREYLVNLSEKQTLENADLINQIEKNLDRIELQMEEAVPRDFVADPLTGSELFIEDMKVIVNLFYNATGKPIPFIGAYAAERNRIHKVHEEFKFKEKLAEARYQVDILKKSVKDSEILPEKAVANNI